MGLDLTIIKINETVTGLAKRILKLIITLSISVRKRSLSISGQDNSGKCFPTGPGAYLHNTVWLDQAQYVKS